MHHFLCDLFFDCYNYIVYIFLNFYNERSLGSQTLYRPSRFIHDKCNKISIGTNNILLHKIHIDKINKQKHPSEYYIIIGEFTFVYQS